MDYTDSQDNYDHSHDRNRNWRRKRSIIHITEDGEIISLSLAQKEARKVLTVKTTENATTIIYGDARVKQLKLF